MLHVLATSFVPFQLSPVHIQNSEIFLVLLFLKRILKKFKTIYQSNYIRCKRQQTTVFVYAGQPIS